MNKEKKLFSIKWKLTLIFGFMFMFFMGALGFPLIRMSRNAVMEKVETHLIDKAHDTSKNINTKIQGDFKKLQAIADSPTLRANKISYQEKAYLLEKEAKDQGFSGLYICDVNNNLYLSDGKILKVADKAYYKSSIKGKNNITEPYTDVDGFFCISASVPVYDYDKKIKGVLIADFEGLSLNQYLTDIKVGQTGYGYILDETGHVIAHKVEKLVRNANKSVELCKENPKLRSLAKFEAIATFSNLPALPCIASFSISNGYISDPNSGNAVSMWVGAKDLAAGVTNTIVLFPDKGKSVIDVAADLIEKLLITTANVASMPSDLVTKALESASTVDLNSDSCYEEALNHFTTNNGVPDQPYDAEFDTPDDFTSLAYPKKDSQVNLSINNFNCVFLLMVRRIK